MPESVSTRSAYKMLTCIYLCRTLLFFAPYADFFLIKGFRKFYDMGGEKEFALRIFFQQIENDDRSLISIAGICSPEEFVEHDEISIFFLDFFQYAFDT